MKNYFVKITILVLLLAAALGVCCRVVFTQNHRFGSSTAYNLSSYLAEHGVIVDEDLIDTDTVYVFNANLRSVTADKSALSNNILGETPSVLAEAYTAKVGTVTFTGTMFSFKPSESYGENIIGNAGRYDAGKRVERLLESLDFNLSGSTFEVGENKNGYSVNITKTIERLPVFDNSMVVEIDKDGAKLIEGRWYCDYGKIRDKREMRSVADALFELLHTKKGDEKIRIEKITPGYLLTDTASEESDLKAVWQFTKSDGGVIYING